MYNIHNEIKINNFTSQIFSVNCVYEIENIVLDDGRLFNKDHFTQYGSTPPILGAKKALNILTGGLLPPPASPSSGVLGERFVPLPTPLLPFLFCTRHTAAGELLVLRGRCRRP